MASIPAIKWDTGASTSEHNIRYWWSGNPRNIGIHCGLSGLLVVDEDAPGELARFCADRRVDMPETYTVITAKGKHYYFRDTEAGALGNREGAFGGYAINIRSGSGYVIAPGSLHATGVVYTGDGGVIAPLPPWIPEAIRGGKQQQTNSTPTAEDLLNSDPFGTHQGFTLPEVIKDHHRHNTLVSYASSLRARDCPLSEAEDLFRYRAFPRCEQPPIARFPVTLEEALGKLHDIYNRYPPGRSEGYQKRDQSQPADGGPQPEAPSSWRPVDLTSVLDGTWKPLEPSVGRRLDGKGLFYPGRTHTVVSETEAGKTWFALAAAILEMAAGCHVFYIDFEDDEGSVVGRLLTLGVDPEAIRDLFHYIRPEHPLQGAHLIALCEELASYPPSLALLDGITEAMTLHSLNPNDNVDIALFNRQVITPLTASGAAQVSFDHVTKDRQGRGRYALGGVHKLNIVNGAGYTFENRQPFGIGVTGRSTLKIAKDRPGQLRRNADGQVVRRPSPGQQRRRHSRGVDRVATGTSRRA